MKNHINKTVTGLSYITINRLEKTYLADPFMIDQHRQHESDCRLHLLSILKPILNLLMIS